KQRVIIVCEGETEQEFCQKTLANYFLEHEIYVNAPLIKKTRGGIAPWTDLENQIRNHLREQDTIVTTLFDYYGLKPTHHFPKWEESLRIPDKFERMDSMEKGMKDSIEDSVR